MELTREQKDHRDKLIELGEKFDELEFHFIEVIGLLEDVESEYGQVFNTSRLRQVRAQIESALGGDHEWLGGSMYTLRGEIESLEETLNADPDDE